MKAVDRHFRPFLTLEIVEHPHRRDTFVTFCVVVPDAGMLFTDHADGGFS